MKKLLAYRMLGDIAKMTGSLVLCAGYAGLAASQGLPSVPGITDLQKPVASTVQTVCIALNGLVPGTPVLARPNPNGTPAERLSNSCTLMVSTAFHNQGGPPPFDPNGAFNLRITDEQLKRGIQAIAPVQMNAQKQISVESSKMSLVGSRLLDLRSGARGLVVGLNGQEASQAADAQASSSPLAGARGGAAGPDDAMSGRWGGFVNLGYAFGDVDQTPLQDAYKYGSFSVLGGADYRVSDAFVVGGAISYSDTHSDYKQSLGNVKARTVGIAGYGTYYVDTWYVDGFLAYGSVDYDSTRNILIPSNNPTARAINTSATAKPKGDQWSASIGVGRSFDMAPITVTPTARLGYIWVKNKAFSEDEPNNGLGLAVDSRTIQSLQSSIGAKVSMTVNSSVGVFVPYATANWLHEFRNGTPSITSKYIADPLNTIFSIPTASPTRDYAVLGIGTSVTLPNNLAGFAQFSGAAGLRNESNYGIVLGVRKQF
ncbi:MAG: autotransporter outer membrane beta-barrel domain-containing protein [Pseudomonadota bacterium]|nr:autotransporter outer membrane beta-barrel domain-containing protein [Pseudomonadota bacterium]